MQNVRWSTAIAAAALIALPVAGVAQTAPQPNPPAQASPSTQPPPASTAPAAKPAGQMDATAAKTHLSEARDTLSQLTAMPEAAKLQGAARTQVSQLISDFNALITSQTDWRAAYAKVDGDLSALLGPENASDSVGTAGAGTPAPTATAGTAGSPGAPAASAPPAAGSAIDPAIRGKLVEFRTHLKAFEKAAGEAPPAIPPSVATPSTANPVNPAASPNPAAANPATEARPSTPMDTASPTAGMSPADRTQAANEVNAAAGADARKELDAISAILGRSRSGALTKAQAAQVRKHVEILRALLTRQ